MKNVFTVMVAAMMVLHLAAQSKLLHIPAAVDKAFVTQFPKGRLKNWEQKNEGYMATFRQNGRKYFACYTPDGTWVATESSVKWTRDLPGAVRTGWSNCKYRDWLILDMKKIVKPVQTLYAIHVGQVQSLGPDDADIGSEYILFFSDKGELIKEERKS